MTMTIRRIDVEIDLENISDDEIEKRRKQAITRGEQSKNWSFSLAAGSRLSRLSIAVAAQEIVGVAASSGRARQVF